MKRTLLLLALCGYFLTAKAQSSKDTTNYTVSTKEFRTEIKNEAQLLTLIINGVHQIHVDAIKRDTLDGYYNTLIGILAKRYNSINPIVNKTK